MRYTLAGLAVRSNNPGWFWAAGGTARTAHVAHVGSDAGPRNREAIMHDQPTTRSVAAHRALALARGAR